jgi:hypothetical protein
MIRVSLVLPSILLTLVAFGSLISAHEQESTKSRQEEIRQGSQTAKGGFQNEDEIRDKFNHWKSDADAQAWLSAMNYELADIRELTASKPHGEKADVEVRIQTNSGERVEGISIKLVSTVDGFNQIDKRWLKTYAQMWEMPADVHEALKFFVGEVKPPKPGRDKRRLFLDEMDAAAQKAILQFFRDRREKIVSALFAGEGEHAAKWIMVTYKGELAPPTNKNPGSGASKIQLPNEKATWTIRTTAEAARFFGDGEIEITPAGSLKIGRITMQRKGGDNGRESANMLQFKINPLELLELNSAADSR